MLRKINISQHNPVLSCFAYYAYNVLQAITHFTSWRVTQIKNGLNHWYMKEKLLSRIIFVSFSSYGYNITYQTFGSLKVHYSGINTVLLPSSHDYSCDIVAMSTIFWRVKLSHNLPVEINDISHYCVFNITFLFYVTNCI